MKIYIGPHTNWFGPYQLAEKLMFWTDKYDDPRVHSFGYFLATGKKYREKKIERMGEDPPTLLCRFLSWIHTFKKRRVYIKIDKYDTWNMDTTLGMIALPMLKQLQVAKHGAPFVDDEDVPDELKSTAAPPKENEYDTDANHFKRWDYAIAEMIFAFEHKLDDTWQDKFRSGKHDLIWVQDDKLYNEEKVYRMEKGPDDTYQCDYDGIAEVEKRIQNGFRLFGKYYQSLWD
jgi:hypothetical protein